MLELVAFVVVTGVLPVLVNKSTQQGRLEWIVPHLRQAWTAIFAFFSLYLLTRTPMLEATVQLKNWLSRPLWGYAICAVCGAVLLCGYWWFAGLEFANAPMPLEVLTQVSAGEYPPGTVVGGIKWVSGFTDLRVTFSNPSGIDYDDLDVLLEPDAPIAQIGQVSSISDVSFIGDVTKEKVDIGGALVLMPTATERLPSGFTLQVPLQQLSTARYRVRCQRLPRKSSMQLVLAIAEVDGPRTRLVFSIGGPVDHPDSISLPPTLLSPTGRKVVYKQKKPTQLAVDGTYTAAGRPRTIKLVSVIVRQR